MGRPSSDSEQFDAELGILAHCQLQSLKHNGRMTMNALAKRALELPLDASSHLSSNPTLSMANAALRVLANKGFVREKLSYFEITPSGLHALERYPDSFSKLFVERELLNPSETRTPVVSSGWKAFRRTQSRRER